MPAQPNQHDEAVITPFLNRLREQIESVLPEDNVGAVLETARSALRQGLADFELVSRHELDGHLAALEQLTATVRDLERRIGELEAGR